jgi:hypothetical protein
LTAANHCQKAPPVKHVVFSHHDSGLLLIRQQSWVAEFAKVRSRRPSSSGTLVTSERRPPRRHEGDLAAFSAPILRRVQFVAGGRDKGILFSTSGFQSGAINYAASHGVATVTVVAGTWLFETRAQGPSTSPPSWVQFDRFAGIRLSPRGKGISCHAIDCDHIDALSMWFVNANPGAQPRMSLVA